MIIVTYLFGKASWALTYDRKPRWEPPFQARNVDKQDFSFRDSWRIFG